MWVEPLRLTTYIYVGIRNEHGDSDPVLIQKDVGFCRAEDSICEARFLQKLPEPAVLVRI